MRELKFRVWDKVKEKILNPQAISFDIQSSAPICRECAWPIVGTDQELRFASMDRFF